MPKVLLFLLAVFAAAIVVAGSIAFDSIKAASQTRLY
jgi:hypothetical protein